MREVGVFFYGTDHHFFKELPRVQKFSSFDDVCPSDGRSCALLEQSQDLGVTGLGVGFSLLPDSLKSAVLDPADLDDSSGAACGVTLDLHVLTNVLLDVFLEPGGWSTVSSCTAVLNINDVRHNKIMNLQLIVAINMAIELLAISIYRHQ